MSFFHRLRLAWRVLWYRGPWLPRYDFPDEPSLFDYPPDVVPSFPAPGSGELMKLVSVDTPMLRLISRRARKGDLYDWKSITEQFTAKGEEQKQ